MLTRIGVALVMTLSLLAGTALNAAEFKGRVIYVGDNVLEVKKKSREMTFRLNDETVIIRDGVRSVPEDLALCQTVRIVYKGKGKARIALKVEILKESDCLPRPEPAVSGEDVKPAPAGEVSGSEDTGGRSESAPAPEGEDTPGPLP